MRKFSFQIDPSILLLPLLFFGADFLDLLIFLSAVLIHEAGHLFAIRFYGYKQTGFSLSLMGGKIALSDPYIPYRKEIIIYLSGPFFNLLGAIFSFFLLRAHFTKEALFFLFANLLLALFNLLPLPGLDGEGALFALLSLLTNIEKRDRILKKTSFFFFILLSFSSLFLFYKGKNPSLIFLALGLKVNEYKRKKATNTS